MAERPRPVLVPAAVSALRRSARATARGTRRLARAAAPHVRHWLGHAAGLAGRGLRALGRGAVRHRGVLGAIGLRAMWWAALVLLVWGGQVVLDPSAALPERHVVLAPFVLGLVLCAALRLAARPGDRHLGLASLGLGSVHGAAVVLVWTAFGG